MKRRSISLEKEGDDKGDHGCYEDKVKGEKRVESEAVHRREGKKEVVGSGGGGCEEKDRF